VSQQLIIRSEPAKALGPREEAALLRAAVRRNTAAAALRLRLAHLLNLMDSFDETIALLGAVESSLGHAESLALGHALLARDNMGDVRRARDLAGRAVRLAQGERERSAALAEGAKAAFRLGDGEGAVDLLEEALRLNPCNSAAFKRLATHWLRADMPARVLDLADRLESEGAGHARLLASRMLAFARLGRIEEARGLSGLPRFLHDGEIAVPPGWRDLDSFNHALAAELLAHPGRRDGRHGTASRETVRIDSPATGAAPAARALLQRIAEGAQHHAVSLRSQAHPWVAARPTRAILASWCVITGDAGFEDWHTHPHGWMSGTYYAEVPASVVGGRGKAGCLAFGLPEGLAGRDGARRFGRELVRPRPGLLVLFPSHCYHRTFPHGANGRRICISFDLRPD